jgi:5-methylcytosine-specific restriction endonuclease McrA
LIFSLWYNINIGVADAAAGSLTAAGIDHAVAVKYDSMEMAMTQCVVLNADYSFLNVVDWKRAMCLLIKEKVKVLKYSTLTVQTGEGITFKIPTVIKLIKLIRTVYRARVPFSKRNVLIRDGFKCAYCLKGNRFLTIDHIVPRSRGGRTEFENCVAACRTCNHLKGNQTPSEAKMYPSVKAYQPTISEFLRRKIKLLGLSELLREFGLAD